MVCNSSITVPSDDGQSDIVYACTKLRGHVRLRHSEDHCYAPPGAPEEWVWWNDRGELTTDRHDWVEPAPRTYSLRMREDDFQWLKDLLEGPLHLSSKQFEALERVQAALDAAER